MKLKIEELKQKQALLRKVDLGVNDKLTYAVKRLSARADAATKGPLTASQEAIADYTIEQASVDEKGNLVMNGEKHSFTPEARKRLQQFVADENRRFDATVVELEGYLIDAAAPGYERATTLFDDFDKEELAGILF